MDHRNNLFKLRTKYPKNVIISYLNINSIRNKLHNLECFLNKSVDVLAIAETKLDDSFPNSQFLLEGYKKPYRHDVNSRSGGFLVYANKDIPSRQLDLYKFDDDMQVVPIELNLRKQKWLVISIYAPPKQNTSQFLNNLSVGLDFYSTMYCNILVMGDFNVEPQLPIMRSFLESQNLHNHMKEKTCWKSKTGSCIDLILSNKKFSFQHTGVVETGLSDHHLLIYSMLKTNFIKLPPQRYTYRNYKKLNEHDFIRDLQYNLKQHIIFNYGDFEFIFSNLLQKHAPLKTKFFRDNNSPHMSKELRKTIMKRSRLKNIANRTGSPLDFNNYKKQRNLVVSLNKKQKKAFFNSIDLDSDGNKSFWKACKPLFSKVDAMGERIILVEGDEIINNDNKIATVFNEYFNSITDGLEIPQWTNNF